MERLTGYFLSSGSEELRFHFAPQHKHFIFVRDLGVPLWVLCTHMDVCCPERTPFDTVQAELIFFIFISSKILEEICKSEVDVVLGHRDLP